MNSALQFSQDRYVVLPSFLKNPQLSFAYRYIRQLAEAGVMRSGDGQVPGAPNLYGGWVMDGMLSDLQPEVENASGINLFPTYAYSRLYKQGDVLKIHKDRPACEISITLCLGYSAPASWPIWIAGAHGKAAVSLEPGDALLYRGTECDHWREPFQGNHQAQVFLHYVDQNGPYADWKYDKRSSLKIGKPFPGSRAGGHHQHQSMEAARE